MERKTAEEWAELVARWKRSGLTASEFAAKARVKVRTLQWWSSALARRSSPQSIPPIVTDHPPEFLPVHVAQHDAPTAARSAGAGEPIEIVIDGGLALRVGAGFDEDTLKRVLDVLRPRRRD